MHTEIRQNIKYGQPNKRRLPPWLKKDFRNLKSHNVKRLLRKRNLHTVCESAKCPNIFECFSKPTATFMILGNVCTRNCGFCAVFSGAPLPVNSFEPEEIAKTAVEMGLNHVVITSVTRDDLEDGGAKQFALTINAIRKMNSDISIEILTPDFDPQNILKSGKPDIYNHNIETVPRLYPKVRPQADYNKSLKILETIKKQAPEVISKSGIMVGLGEEFDEVISVMRDLRNVGCDAITIGQYLQPSKNHLPVEKFIYPEVFDQYKKIGNESGFKYTTSAPFVRSSYNAELQVRN
ncbi:MAG TPA: lipoyl synthase [Nitrospinota bacterium]|nr:lipoyl synthase [Nitrospinota bacterium]